MATRAHSQPEMNWDARFASIVKETEQSLARVKSQLQMPLTSKRAGTTAHNYSTLSTSPKANPGILKPSSGSTPHSHRRRSVSFDLTSPTQGQRSLPERGGAVMSLLTTRLKDQQKEILNLQESISSLQRSLNQQDRQILSLQTEVKRLQSNGGGTTNTTNTQLHQFKQEVRRELDELRGQLNSSRGSHFPMNDHSVQAVVNELHTSKRLLRGDIENIQEDLSSLKAKLRSHESEAGVCGTSVRDMERRQERVEKVLSKLQDRQHEEEVGRSVHSGSIKDCTTQLHRIRQLMTDIQARLALLEHKSSSHRQQDSTLLIQDLDHSPQVTFDLSSSSSSSHRARSHSSGNQSLSLRGSGNSISSLRADSSLRPSLSLRGSGESLKRPSTSRNPLHTVSPLWGQSSRGGLSDDEDTLDGMSILSSGSEGVDRDLSCDLELDDLSPSTSLLSVGAL